MFQLPYTDANGFRRMWRLDNNWTFVIIGGVILVAVVLDQLVHLFQERRRTRRAGFAVATAPAGQVSPAAPVAPAAAAPLQGSAGPPADEPVSRV